MILKDINYLTTERSMNGHNSHLREIHTAVIGANGSGKSALTVKYMTRRYISEYDPNLEDTYCKHETIIGQECMLWIMDTVEGPHRDTNRYLPWADIILVVYSIINKFSFDYAEHLLRHIAQHDHSMCARQHTVLLIGNKTDMDRYRQVSKSQGTVLASTYGAELFETNTTEEYVLVKTIFHHAICQVFSRIPPPPPPPPPLPSSFTTQTQLNRPSKPKLTRTRRGDIDDHSPSPGQNRSDPEQSTMSLKRTFLGTGSPKSSLTRRSKSPSARFHDVVFSKDRQQSVPEQQAPPRSQNANTLSPPKKSSSALKLLQLFK